MVLSSLTYFLDQSVEEESVDITSPFCEKYGVDSKSRTVDAVEFGENDLFYQAIRSEKNRINESIQ